MRWRNHFRMRKAVFDFCLQAMKPYIARRTTGCRAPVPVAKRLAITLKRLATGADFRSMQELFGIGRSPHAKFKISMSLLLY